MAINIENTFKATNKVLNLAGYVPIFSTTSGRFRALLGIAKVIASIVIAIVLGNGIIAATSLTAGQLLLSGLLDWFRGGIEIVPVYGSIACMTYDLARLVLV